ncbi:hypothetical protein HDK64DRAFT_59899 [Phyllosticta capitalensis]
MVRGRDTSHCGLRKCKSVELASDLIHLLPSLRHCFSELRSVARNNKATRPNDFLLLVLLLGFPPSCFPPCPSRFLKPASVWNPMSPRTRLRLVSVLAVEGVATSVAYSTTIEASEDATLLVELPYVGLLPAPSCSPPWPPPFFCPPTSSFLKWAYSLPEVGGRQGTWGQCVSGVVGVATSAARSQRRASRI